MMKIKLLIPFILFSFIGTTHSSVRPNQHIIVYDIAHTTHDFVWDTYSIVGIFNAPINKDTVRYFKTDFAATIESTLKRMLNEYYFHGTSMHFSENRAQRLEQMGIRWREQLTMLLWDSFEQAEQEIKQYAKSDSVSAIAFARALEETNNKDYEVYLAYAQDTAVVHSNTAALQLYETHIRNGAKPEQGTKIFKTDVAQGEFLVIGSTAIINTLGEQELVAYVHKELNAGRSAEYIAQQLVTNASRKNKDINPHGSPLTILVF